MQIFLYRRTWRRILVAWLILQSGVEYVTPARAETSIAGEWKLIRMPGRIIPDMAEPILKILPNGALTATAGCNYFNARLQLAPSQQWRVSSPTTETIRACRPEVDEVELRFMEKIGVARYFRLDVDAMVLEDANHATLLEFSRRK